MQRRGLARSGRSSSSRHSYEREQLLLRAVDEVEVSCSPKHAVSAAKDQPELAVRKGHKTTPIHGEVLVFRAAAAKSAALMISTSPWMVQK